eukprot:GHVS01073084.1.p1 GENE.GHVS01073084.1~~GHVS01073084.1.p1  ORF type:complete len:591 (+),score=133.74 GHVS01073084.1:567-2339(+)
MEVAQGPSPHSRVAGGNAFRFFGLSRGPSMVLPGKKIGKAFGLAAALRRNASAGSSSSASRRELGALPNEVTAETLPMFEKKLIYHKHEAVHQAHMKGRDEDEPLAGGGESMGGRLRPLSTTTTTAEEPVASSSGGLLEAEHRRVDVFLGVMENRDSSSGTEFSPASSSSSPSFNANERMAGLQVSGRTPSLQHNQHEDKFEAMREEKVGGNEEQEQQQKVEEKPKFLMGKKTDSTLPLEGPAASPLPAAVLAPWTVQHLPVTPGGGHHQTDAFLTPPGRKPFVLELPGHHLGGGGGVQAVVTHIRGAVISRKQSRRRTKRERRERVSITWDKKRREREEKRDEIRMEREEKRQQQLHDLASGDVNELKRNPQGMFDWATWFAESEDEVVVSTASLSEDEPLAASPYWPLDEGTYQTDFVAGDISENLRDQCLTDPMELQGNWQVQLSQSDSISPILAELGFGRMKRTIVAAYPSIVKMSVLSTEPSHQPKIHMVTHLPMGITKQATIEFNGNEVTQPDSDTGAWTTVPYYVNGRAMQRRVNPKGVMFDVRCTFAADPAGVIPGKVMLFQWTFIPRGKAAVVSRRWLQMV